MKQYLLQEYSVIVQMKSSYASWAVGFVALYFAFLTSIGTATGFIMMNFLTVNNIRIGSQHLLTLRYLLVVLAVIGILLHIWAIYMIIYYVVAKNIIVARMMEIEKAIAISSKDVCGVACRMEARYSTTSWRLGSVVVVGAVMAMFFIPWLLVLRFSMSFVQ